MKFADMPKVTHKSIFSSSGYTDGARKKATTHSVGLYTLMPCDRLIGDVGALLSSCESNLLYWEEGCKITPIASESPEPITFEHSTPVLKSSGKEHEKYPHMQNFINSILMRSTEILYPQEPAQTILKTFINGPLLHYSGYSAGPAWPHTHTLDVTSDKAYLNLKSGLFKIDSVTITGNLQWRRRLLNPKFYVLRNVFDQKIFANATITSDGIDDECMWAMVYPETGRMAYIHPIHIPEKHKNLIRTLKIK